MICDVSYYIYALMNLVFGVVVGHNVSVCQAVGAKVVSLIHHVAEILLSHIY